MALKMYDGKKRIVSRDLLGWHLKQRTALLSLMITWKLIQEQIAFVEIPANVKSIGQSAFDGNPYVSNIQISDGVTSMRNCFSNCRKLKTVFISDSVTHIEDNAFSGNTDFLIQCSREVLLLHLESRNTLPGEVYIKAKTEVKDRTNSRKPRVPQLMDYLASPKKNFRVIMESEGIAC